MEPIIVQLIECINAAADPATSPTRKAFKEAACVARRTRRLEHHPMTIGLLAVLPVAGEVLDLPELLLVAELAKPL
jgi:hypothetical protein